MSKLCFVFGLLATLHCAAAARIPTEDRVPVRSLARGRVPVGSFPEGRVPVKPLELNRTFPKEPRSLADVSGKLYYFSCDSDDVVVDSGDAVMLLTPVLGRGSRSCTLKVTAQDSDFTFECDPGMVLHNRDRFTINGEEYTKNQVQKPIEVEGPEIEVTFTATRAWKKNRSITCFVRTSGTSTPPPTPPPSEDCQCGKANVGGLDGRIIGGENADTNEYPWQVAVQYRTGSGTSSCGGTIVSKYFVITAAHCVGSSGDVYVGSGKNNYNQLNFVKVKNVIIHPQWDRPTIDYDIAVLEMGAPFDFSDPRLGPACLPSSNDVHDNKPVTISGWGRTGDGSAPTMLQKVEVTAMSHAACQSKAGGITERMICTEGDGTQVSCFGDSGGPLTYQNAANSYELVGVVSWVFGDGNGSCNPRRPAGFAKITSVELYPWVQQNTNGLAGTCN